MQHIVPLLMNFFSFTLVGFDNSDHNDKSTTSCTSSTHGTASVLFHEIPSIKVSEISLENIDMKVKLRCQEIIPFSTSKHINLPETFTVTSDQLGSNREKGSNRDNYEKQKFILDCVRSIQKRSSNIST